VHVLAAGTEQGAPIPQPGGGFLTDASGRVVVPQLNEGRLRELASSGGGRYARIAPDDRDLDALFPVDAALPAGNVLTEEGEQIYEADVWRDQGVWLVAALLPLLALGFRRGWIALLAAVFLVPAPRADAFEWAQLWKRPDQRGYDALRREEAARAAELFEDPIWRGAAQYRAGDYLASAVTLDGIGSADAHYNRGNALAKAGRLEQAIAAYERALELDPSHEDARYNRDLLQDYLEDNPEQRQQQPPQEQSGSGSNDESRNEQQASTEQGEQQDGEQGDQNDSSSGQETQANAEAQDSSGTDDETHANESSREDGEPGEEQQPGDEQEAPGEMQASATGPEDVEQWASEQAAEQWLRRIPQDPGGLLRRKFLYQYQRLGVDQDGNQVFPNGAQEW
jgi:Ca-activated chloride channel family protein